MLNVIFNEPVTAHAMMQHLTVAAESELTRNVGMPEWRYWLTKYTNKESTIPNIAAFHLTIDSSN